MADDAGTGAEAEAIDVPYDQLLDWLRARNLLHSSYPAHLSAVSSATTAAISSLPSSLLPYLPPSTTSPYLTALHLRAHLLSSSPSPPALTWLGRYSDPVLHQWDSLCRSYQRRHVFLAELSRLLSSHLSSSLPSSLRTAHLSSSSQADLTRRISDARKALDSARDRYRTHCSRIGAHLGETSEPALHRQVIAGISDVHRLLADVVEAAQGDGVVEAVEYYQGWVRWVAEAPADPARPLELPALRKVRDLPVGSLLPPEGGGEGEGGESAGQTGAAGLETWGIEVEAVGEQRGGGGVSTSDKAAGTEGRSSPSPAPAIQWVDDVDPASATHDPAASPSLTSVRKATAPAAGASAPPPPPLPDPTGLLAPAFRAAFLSDVGELTAFLTQRLWDLTQSQATHSPLLSYLHSALPPALHLPSTSPATLGRLLGAVGALTAALQQRRLTQALLIASSPLYAQRLCRQTADMRRGVERGEREVRQLEERWREAGARRERELERAERLQAEVREWKAQLETAITGLLHHPVRIIGDAHL